jgi:hypothetical protein
MKKLLLFTVVIISLVCSAVSSAYFVIKLHNGKEVVTDWYWMEGDQIRFYYHGGVAGFRKDLVEDIEEIEDSEMNVIDIQDRKDTSIKADDKREVGAKPAPGKGIKNREYYLKIKSLLEKAKREAFERYRTAKKVNDRESIRAAFRKASEIAAKLERLKKEVKAANKGILPDWWRTGVAEKPR